MPDKRIEAAAAQRKMMFDTTWSTAVTFEAAFSTSDKDDWYNEARIVRGGYAMSQLSSDFLEEYITFLFDNVRIRGTSKRQAAKTAGIQDMFSQQRKMIREVVETWKTRASELKVTLPVERPNSKIPHYADAEIRDLDIHLKAGTLTRPDFDSQIEEVIERFKITATDLSDWKSSQGIDF